MPFPALETAAWRGVSPVDRGPRAGCSRWWHVITRRHADMRAVGRRDRPAGRQIAGQRSAGTLPPPWGCTQRQAMPLRTTVLLACVEATYLWMSLPPCMALPFAWRCPFHGVKKLKERVAKRKCLKDLKEHTEKKGCRGKGLPPKVEGGWPRQNSHPDSHKEPPHAHVKSKTWC